MISFFTINTFQTDQTLELSGIEKDGKEQCITLKVDAPFYNDPAPPEPSDKKSDIDSKNNKALMGLWDYEVVEAFFLCSKSEQYLEVEFGPHGHHLVLFLNGRKNMPFITQTHTVVFVKNYITIMNQSKCTQICQSGFTMTKMVICSVQMDQKGNIFLPIWHLKKVSI